MNLLGSLFFLSIKPAKKLSAQETYLLLSSLISEKYG